MIVGIMGDIDSGKSIITNLLNEENQYEVIDVYRIYVEILKKEELTEEIQNNFIEYMENNIFNEIKFFIDLYTNKEKYEKCIKIILKYLEEEIDKKVNQSTKPIIVESKYLPLTKYYDMCNIKVLVENGIKIELDENFKDRLAELRRTGNNKDFNYTWGRVEYKREDMDYIINISKEKDRDKVKRLKLVNNKE